MSGPPCHIAPPSDAATSPSGDADRRRTARTSARGRMLSWLMLCCLMVGYGCENDLAEVQRLATEEDLGKEVATDVRLIYSDSAIVRVQVESPRMIRYTDKKEPRQEFPEGLTAHFYAPNLQETSTLSAGYGVRYEREQRVVLRDSVVWHSINGEQLETEELIWDEKNERIHTDKFVVIRRPGEIIYGYGFEASQDFDRARIKAIEGRIKVKEPPAPDSGAPQR